MEPVVLVLSLATLCTFLKSSVDEASIGFVVSFQNIDVRGALR